MNPAIISTASAAHRRGWPVLAGAGVAVNVVLMGVSSGYDVFSAELVTN
jgi:hypothetical protein